MLTATTTAGETVSDAILRSRSVGKRKILRPGGLSLVL